MQKWIYAAFVALLFSVNSEAQSAGQPNEGLTVAPAASSGAFTMSWWGHAGSAYYILHSDDLLNWSYFPVIEIGGNQVIVWGFTSSSSKMFLRLQIASTSISSDGDGIPDSVKIAAGIDPFDAPIVRLQVTGFTAP